MTHFKLFSIIMLSSLLTLDALASSNIDTTDKYAWSENSGWMNFNDHNSGVMVYDDHLEGDAWAENIGWIRLGSNAVGSNVGGGTPYYANTSRRNYGVNHDGDGNLSGYAWSENAGWINFNPSHNQVTINTRSGVFDGYAWSENVGWIHFQNTNPTYNVSWSNFQDASPDYNQTRFGDSRYNVVQFSRSRFTGEEDSGEAFVNVTCTGTCDNVSVNLVSTDGTAISHDDYNQCRKTITFTTQNRLTKRVRCTLIDDDDNESSEFFHLSLGNVIGADLGEPNVAKVIIRDNDNDGTGNINITASTNELNIIPEPADGFVFSHWEGWCADYAAANGRIAVPSNKNISSCTPIFVPDE